MKEAILTQLSQPDSKCRVLFAAMAMGMGVDIPCVREVIHIGPPRSVQEYYHEAGQAGRDGQQSRATLYYNNRAMAANKPGMTDNIRSYCKSTGKCLRKQLMYFLDAPPPVTLKLLSLQPQNLPQQKLPRQKRLYTMTLSLIQLWSIYKHT